MAFFYSASTNQFYAEGLGERPQDAVRITPTRHRQLLDAQAKGSLIVAGDKGKPALTTQRPRKEEIRAALIDRIKREAGRRIEIVAPLWRQMNALRAQDYQIIADLGQKIDAIREASNLIEACITDLPSESIARFAVADHPAWPIFDEGAAA